MAAVDAQIDLRNIVGNFQGKPCYQTAAVLPEKRWILDGIAALGRRHLGREIAADPSSRLVDDLELDSLQLLTLAVEVENRFRVRLSEDDDQAIETVDDLVGTIERRLAEDGR